MMYTDGVNDDGAWTSKKMPSLTWPQIRKAIKRSHLIVSQMTNQTPHNLCFRQIGSARRLYFLSHLATSHENTLLYVDLPMDDGLQLRQLEWHDALQPLNQLSYVHLSKEEQLLRERKRLRSGGITSYDLQESGEIGHFAFAANNSLFVCRDDYENGQFSALKMPVTEVLTRCSNTSRIDPKLCPTNPQLLAFVSDHDIWVTNTATGSEKRLTFAHKGKSDLASDPLSAGVPSFVIQEEFDRYTGYWWQPAQLHTDGSGEKFYRILYEEVDESQVSILKIVSPASQGANVDEYRYPKAGSQNATSTLKIVEFVVNENGEIDKIFNRDLAMPLFAMFPGMEYLVKAGWTRDGHRVYFELIDRRQKTSQLFLIDCDEFLANDNSSSPFQMDTSSFVFRSIPKLWIIYEDRSDIWINADELLHFLPETSPNVLRFIRGSEKSGFLHLFLVSVCLDDTICQDDRNDDRLNAAKARLLSEVQLTSGDWAIDGKEMWVDDSRGLVYFIGYKDSPLETHLYVVSYRSPGHVTRLTPLGYSHTITMDETCRMFATVYSSISTPNACEVYRLDDRGSTSVVPYCIGSLLKPTESLEWKSPELFSFSSSSGFTFHGMLYKPKDLEPHMKYPVVLFVYGGPQVQLVSNSFKAVRFVRLHNLAEMGFVVVVVDGRGSCNRGSSFESHIKSRLGTVEVDDQVEGLQWLSRQHDFMDMDRVAIYGWSYGGYVSLMALVQHPEIFKVAIAGAPVTSWDLYDTGYTERYMDLPETNPVGYLNGSVLGLAEKFPNQEGRLLIVQGLMDENVHFYHTSSLIEALVKACKPHTVQVYPNERHGLRSSEANEHYETMLISFLQKNL